MHWKLYNEIYMYKLQNSSFCKSTATAITEHWSLYVDAT